LEFGKNETRGVSDDIGNVRIGVAARSSKRWFWNSGKRGARGLLTGLAGHTRILLF